VIPMKRRDRLGESGSTIVEFAIVAPLLVLLFFGSIGLGIMMGRYIQTIHVCRDIAHMYVDGVDFTQTASQNIVIQELAAGTGMTAAGGNGVVILSRISTVYQVDCDAAGYSGSCNNLNRAVITQRITFGNTSLRSSSFGTPTSTLMDSAGNISPSVYLQNTDASVQATGFATLMTAASGAAQQQGDAAWVAEVFFTYPDIGFLGTSTAGGAYSRFIF
jgi:Flp pilus assembly protein TadG